jgi:hypothetical protein
LAGAFVTNTPSASGLENADAIGLKVLISHFVIADLPAIPEYVLALEREKPLFFVVLTT